VGHDAEDRNIPLAIDILEFCGAQYSVGRGILSEHLCTNLHENWVGDSFAKYLYWRDHAGFRVTTECLSHSHPNAFVKSHASIGTPLKHNYNVLPRMCRMRPAMATSES
jgi:hypothetical protein